MKGWKTWTGFGVMIASAVLKGMGFDHIATIVTTIGGSIMAVGIAHKIEKSKDTNK